MDIKTELSHLEQQINLLKRAVTLLSPTEIGYRELTSVVGPLLTLSTGTAESVKLLAEQNHLRAVIILARPFVETIINLAFICANGNDAVIKSKQYAYQKGYRDLFRDLNVNEFVIKSGLSDHKTTIDQYIPQGLKDAIDSFTTSKGKEKMSWTEETTKEKLEIVGKKYGVGVNGFLAFAFYTIYRDVSEIIHGSYYGMLIFTGMQNKDITSFQSANEAAEYFTDHQFKLTTLILQQVSIAIYAMIEVLAQEFSDVKSMIDLKQEASQVLNDYIKVVKANSPPPKEP